MLRPCDAAAAAAGVGCARRLTATVSLFLSVFSLKQNFKNIKMNTCLQTVNMSRLMLVFTVASEDVKALVL